MAGRPEKRTISYFPHYTKNSKTIFILENKYGLIGYAFWFKLLELLCNSSNLYYDCRGSQSLEYLSARTKVESDKAIDILNTLSEIGKIDKILWGNRVIWCQALVDNLTDIFKRRKTSAPEKPINLINVNNNSIYVNNKGISVNNKDSKVENAGIYAAQSKVKESKVKENKVYKIPHEKIIGHLNKKTGKNFRVINGTKRLISGRYSEGYVYEDFIKVIDIKTGQWKDNNDYKKFLRPETLFKANHFESYLNEAITNEKLIEDIKREEDYQKEKDNYKHKPISPKTMKEIDKILDGKILRHKNRKLENKRGIINE